MNLKTSEQLGDEIRISRLEVIFILSLSLIFIVAMALFFLVGGYSQSNDIMGVLRIASFDGQARWINGFYGPGYAYLASFIGLDVFTFGLFYHSLLFLFVLTVGIFSISITSQKETMDKVAVYLTILFLVCITVFNLGLNYTDGIFLLLLFLGGVGVFYYLFVHQNPKYLIPSALLLGSSILFRHHGYVFLTLLAVNLGVFAIRSKTQVNRKHIFIFAFCFFSPILISTLHLSTLQGVVSWQKFNLYKFFYGVNWHEVGFLLQTEEYKKFNLNLLAQNEPFLILRVLVTTSYSAFKNLAPFLLALLFLAFITKEKKYLLFVGFFLLYTIAVLPGWVRGIYPLYLVFTLLIVYSILLKKVPPRLILISLLIASPALALSFKGWVKEAGGTISSYNYVTNILEPELSQYGVTTGNEIFTDDYNLFFSNYDILRVCNFGGWLMLHPKFKNKYDPGEILRSGRSDDCQLKVIVAYKNGYIHGKYIDFEYRKKVTLKNHTLYFM